MPSDVLRKIIEYLEVLAPAGGFTNESILDLKNVSAVNTVLQRLATESFWKSIVLSFNTGAAPYFKSLLDNNKIDVLLSQITKSPNKILGLFGKIESLYVDLSFDSINRSTSWYNQNTQDVNNYLESCSAIVPFAAKLQILDLKLSCLNVDSPQDRKNLQGKISSVLSTVNVQRFKKLNLTLHTVTNEVMELVPTFLPCVTSLTIIGMPIASWVSFIPTTGLPSLEKLEIYRVPYQQQDSEDQLINFWKTISNSPNLTSLFIAEIPVPSLLKLTLNLSKITSFSMARTFASVEEWSETTSTILQSMSALENLSLESVVYSSTPNGFQVSPSTIVCTKLKTLRLKFWCPISFCSTVFQHCTSLTEFSLEDFVIGPEFPSCGSVTTIYLKNCSVGSYQGLAMSSNNLRTLRIDPNVAERLSIEDLQVLKKACPSLEVIEIIGLRMAEGRFLLDPSISNLFQEGTGSSLGNLILSMK